MVPIGGANWIQRIYLGHWRCLGYWSLAKWLLKWWDVSPPTGTQNPNLEIDLFQTSLAALALGGHRSEARG